MYDRCLQLTVTFLKCNGYLSSGQWKTGIVAWSIGEGQEREITARIKITVSMEAEPYIHLNYTVSENLISYQIRLVSIPSNLQKGQIWFFVCPVTGRLCRKLYCIGERFLHREAYNGCMYTKQTYSRRLRREMKIFDRLIISAEIVDELNKSYFKETYNGKTTRRFQRLLKRAEKIGHFEMANFIN